jgi:hypothetical protein
MLGFHNGRGGALIVGVSDDHRVVGTPRFQVKDTNQLRGKLHKYIGNMRFFQDSIKVGNDRWLWVIFITAHAGAPQPALANGPLVDNKYEVRKNEYYLRKGDQIVTCTEPGDLEQLFANFSANHLHAYLYDVDEPWTRLLAPDFTHFVGRQELLTRIYRGLQTRHPVVALDGMGGVGKTATAIQVVRQIYDEQTKLFIVSLSAKTRVWHGLVGSRRAGFSGLTEFLRETASVLGIEHQNRDAAALKQQIIDTITDVDGLFFIDNVEDVDDPDLLTFLSMEIPAPVKVLVTSRIDKGLGALTVSVPQMTTEEARQLLMEELRYRGYTTALREEEEIDELLRATGGVPLALKWAADIATNTGSLHEAVGRLHGKNLDKRQFLRFCFATMYDFLSPLATQVAKLCPYLGAEWNPATLSLALDEATTNIIAAIIELKDRGIMLASTTEDQHLYRVLPLTMDFLADKWHEDVQLQRQVARRLASAVNSGEYEGLLLNMPRDQRVLALRDRAEELYRAKQLPLAAQVVDLAISCSPRYDARLRFLAGKIQYELGERSAGLAGMQQAASDELHTDDQTYLAMSLLARGTHRDQTEALAALERVLADPRGRAEETMRAFCGLALELRAYTSLSTVLAHCTEPEQAYWMATSLSTVFDDDHVLIRCGAALAATLHVAATATVATSAEQAHLKQTGRRIETRLRRAGLSTDVATA